MKLKIASGLEIRKPIVKINKHSYLYIWYTDFLISNSDGFLIIYIYRIAQNNSAGWVLRFE